MSNLTVCRQYSELAYANVKIPWSTTGERRKTLDCYNVMPLITGGTSAKAKEFPHMVNGKRIKKMCSRIKKDTTTM